MNVTVIKQIPGPHEGWCTQVIAHRGGYHRVLTIDRGENESSTHIGPCNVEGAALPGGVITFSQVLTVQTAYDILVQLRGAREAGREDGAAEAQRAMREALGL